MLYNLQGFIKKDFDIAHAHFGQNGNLLLDLQKLNLLKAKRTVASFHGSDLHFYHDRYYRKLFGSHAAFTVNSGYMAERLWKMGRVKAKILPMGVNKKFFSDGKKEQNPGTFTLLTVARLIPVKGIEYGIKAVKKLVDEGMNVQYIIVGEGSLLDELKQLALELHISNSVHFTGFKPQTDLLDYYRRSDVFLLPGITTKEGAQEAQGLVIQEAQAMRLPVVVTDAGGMSEGMANGRTGYVVLQKNPDALAAKLKLLFDQPDLLKEMGEAGREFVHKKFDSKQLTKELVENVYQL